MPKIMQITATELSDKMKLNEDLFLLDVRNPDETDFCRLPNAYLIPLPQLEQRMHELPQDKPIVAYCHHGRRSQMALEYLKSKGFKELINLEEGIDAWSRDVDGGVPRY